MIIIVAGMPGSGKNVLVQTALKMGFSKISMGDVVRHHAAQSGLDAGDASIGSFASSERLSHGPAVWAERTLAMMPGGHVVIDGTRSLAEISRFKEVLGNGLKVLAVTAPRDVRFRRLVSRGREDDPANLDDFEKRDSRELSWGLGEAIGSADIELDNSGGIEEFRESCRGTLRSLIEGN